MQQSSSENRTFRYTITRSATIIAVAAGVVVLDRVMKFLALTQWTDRRVELLPGVQLMFLLNKGIALSVPLTGTVGLMLILVLFFTLLVWLIFSSWNKQWLRASLLFVVLLGAGSNILDRFLYGGVVDYLQIVFPSVINLADVMVVAGIAGLLVVSRRRTA